MPSNPPRRPTRFPDGGETSPTARKLPRSSGILVTTRNMVSPSQGWLRKPYRRPQKSPELRPGRKNCLKTHRGNFQAIGETWRPFILRRIVTSGGREHRALCWNDFLFRRNSETRYPVPRSASPREHRHGHHDPTERARATFEKRSVLVCVDQFCRRSFRKRPESCGPSRRGGRRGTPGEPAST